MAELENKQENETWLEWACRMAAPWHLQDDVTESYNNYMKQDYGKRQSAFMALWDWDL